MIFDDVSNRDLQIINNVINGFFHMLKGVDIALTFRNPEDIEVVELDEMHTYIGSKKTTVGYGLLLIETGIGSSIVKLVRAEQKQG